MTRGTRRRGFLRDNSLTLGFLVLFLIALSRTGRAGHRLYNEEQREQGEQAVGFFDFLASSRSPWR